MESSSDNNRIGWAGSLLLGATTAAMLLTLASAMSRADSGSELAEGHVFDLVLVAPMWAAVVFGITRSRGGTKTRAATFACAVYVLVAIMLIGLDICKYKLRTAALERFSNQSVSEVLSMTLTLSGT